jgi:hypothetical protein
VPFSLRAVEFLPSVLGLLKGEEKAGGAVCTACHHLPSPGNRLSCSS